MFPKEFFYKVIKKWYCAVKSYPMTLQIVTNMTPLLLTAFEEFWKAVAGRKWLLFLVCEPFLEIPTAFYTYRNCVCSNG